MSVRKAPDPAVVFGIADDAVQEVLLEGPSKTNEARLSGRTSQNKPVMVDAAPDLAGELLPIRIEESTGFTLYGVPCPSRG